MTPLEVRLALNNMADPAALSAYLESIIGRAVDLGIDGIYEPPDLDEARVIADNLIEQAYLYLRDDVPFFKSVTIPMSGGADSTLVASILREAADLLLARDGRKVVLVGFALPCKLEASADEYTNKGLLAARLYCDEVAEVNVYEAWAAAMNSFFQAGQGSFTFESGKSLADLQEDMGLEPLRYLDTDQRSWKLTSGNTAARMRMIFSYGVAALLGGAQVSTDNLTEGLMGFWTLCGDEGTFKLIQGLLKGLEQPQVMHVLDIPDIFIVQKPTDGLGVGDGDVAQLYGDLYTGEETYVDVDVVILRMFHGWSHPDPRNLDVIREDHPIWRQFQNTQFKRDPFCLRRSDLGLKNLPNITFAS